MRYHRSCSLAVLTIAVAFGCSNPTGPESRLDRAEELWNARKLQNYSWVVSRTCECLREMSGPTRVVVRGGVVESRWFLPDDKSLPDSYAAAFPDVEGMFAMIRSNLANGTPIVDVEYDPVNGYPVRVAVGSPVPDGVTVYRVSDFTRN